MVDLVEGSDQVVRVLVAGFSTFLGFVFGL
jgi:hypothetical protein